MGKNSAIEWTDHTLNFWHGCRPVSEGCANCYMYREKKRYGLDPTSVVRSRNKTFRQARRWHEPARVFVCSWSDFFIEDADSWREEAWEEIRNAPHLTWLILTKRPENIADRLPADWHGGWPNVFLGVTAENQRRWNERVPLLCSIPAARRFVSYEPALGPINARLTKDTPCSHVGCLQHITHPCEVCGYQAGKLPLDLIIAGCESGTNRRTAKEEWLRGIKDQCVAVGVHFFLKQMDVDGKLVKMPELDGRVWAQMPDANI